MNFGTVVNLPGSKSHFVLVKVMTKKVSGHIEEKKFYALKDHPNMADEMKPYTKARAATAEVVQLNNLTAGEKEHLFQLKKQRWEVHTN